MLIERIWAANDLRNFQYLIACSQTGEALVVDPLDARACLATARTRGFNITQIVNTHEHLDHTAGNAEVVHEVILFLDLEAPTTLLTLDATPGANGWILSNATATRS